MASASNPSVYVKGSPLGWDKEWYHGELSRVEAEQALIAVGCDCFLVRVSEGALSLSLIHHGLLRHVNIKYGRGGYHEIDCGSAQYRFIDLQDMISYYSTQAIKGLNATLGVACEKRNTTGINLKI